MGYDRDRGLKDLSICLTRMMDATKETDSRDEPVFEKVLNQGCPASFLREKQFELASARQFNSLEQILGFERWLFVAFRFPIAYSVVRPLGRGPIPAHDKTFPSPQFHAKNPRSRS